MPRDRRRTPPRSPAGGSWSLAIALATVGVVGTFLALAAVPGLVAREIDAGRSGPNAAASAAVPGTIAVEPVSFRDVEIGRSLFHDRRLSADGSVSCASCHRLESHGVDGRELAIGVGGRVGSFNTPSLYNLEHSHRFGWKGEARAIEDLIDGAVEDADMLATNWARVERLVGEDATLRVELERRYGAADRSAVRRALADFIRRLRTPGAPYDAWLGGEASALDDAARRGEALFDDLGCNACHQGTGFGGTVRQSLGVMDDVYLALAPEGAGRSPIADRWPGLGALRVPPLRNVAATGPWFHDGSVASLSEAVRLMARHQLGIEPSETEIRDLVAFLESLTGRLPSEVTGR
ncbi:MAG: cytochrome c peroxidase [Planctomycetota bacterium]